MTIKELRLQKGWTQEDLARHSGLSARTIQRAESGKSIGAESLKCLAAVFETPISSLRQSLVMDNSNEIQNDTDIDRNTTNCTNADTRSKDVKLSQIENSAISFGKSLFTTPSDNKPDPLTKVERNAINYGKRLLKKLKP